MRLNPASTTFLVSSKDCSALPMNRGFTTPTLPTRATLPATMSTAVPGATFSSMLTALAPVAIMFSRRAVVFPQMCRMLLVLPQASTTCLM